MLLIVSVLLHFVSVRLHIVSVLLHVVSFCYTLLLFGLLHFSEIPSKTRELPEPLPGKKQQKANEGKRGSFHFFFLQCLYLHY